MTPLAGGPCELESAHVQRSSTAGYFAAVLKFSNHETATFPLYVPLEEGGVSLEPRAMALASEIGRIAARVGAIDPVDWVLRDRIPLIPYLKQALLAARDAASLHGNLQFSTHVSLGNSVRNEVRQRAALCVRFYDHGGRSCRSKFILTVPPEFAAPDLAAHLHQAVDDILGPEARRHRLRSSPYRKSPMAPDQVVTSEPHIFLSPHPGYHTRAIFVLSPYGDAQFSCSLGVKDAEVALARLKQVQDFIRERLASDVPLKIADIRAYCEALAQKSSVERAPRRVNPARAGPVIVYHPRVVPGSEPAREALRVYTALSGRPESGFELRINVVGPNGRGSNQMFRVAIVIPPALSVTLDTAESLRADVREFMEDRLSKFYQAGGLFRDRADIGFGSTGKPALTPQGAEKLQRVLEGRLVSKYVTAALKAGISNPFDADLPPEKVRGLGGFCSMPQPAHPALRLLNPHEVASSHGQTCVRATLQWTDPEGRELLKGNLEFAGIASLVTFVHDIDHWTASAREAGETALPIHAGKQFLRRLCQPHRDPRYHEID